MQTVTIRHGKVFGQRWKAQVNAFALNPEAENFRESCKGLHILLKQTNRLPALTSNGVDESMGTWYGARYEMEDGKFVVLKAQHDFMKVPHSLSELVIRLRSTGPMLMIKGVFPAIPGFAHSNDLVLFQGRGDILEEDELQDLDLWELIHPFDRDRSFDLDQREECYDIMESTRVPHYSDKPDLVAVHGEGNRTVGVAAIPKPQARKVRITKPKGGRTQTKRRRRRRRHE